MVTQTMSQKSLRLVMKSLFALLLFLSYRALGVDRLEGRILDDKTGQPVAATLILTGGDGRRIEIDGKHAHVDYLGQRRCYVDGVFTLSARPDRLVVELRRGLETLPLKTEVDIRQQGTEALTFRLRRWIDMRELGYLSGDTHVHLLSQSKSHIQMRAEDLNVLNLLVSDFTHDREKFTGHLDAVSTSEHSVFVGQEARDWQHGHICLLRIKQIVEPFKPFGGTFQGRTERNLVLARILREARSQGGIPPGHISAIYLGQNLPSTLPSGWSMPST